MAFLKTSTLALVIVSAAALAACSAGTPGDGSGGAGGGEPGSTSSTSSSTGQGGSSTSSGSSSSQSSSSASSSSSSSSSSTSSSSSSGGGTPIVCDDAAHPVTSIPEGECSLLQQDCPAGSTCFPVQDGSALTTQCQPTSGTKTAGTACSADTECVAGLFCADVCTPPCCPTNSTAAGANQPCGSGTCNLKLSYDATSFVQVCSFAPACDLLTPGSCPSGKNCYVQGEGIARCSSPTATNGGNGDACEYLNDCKADHMCVEDPSVCRPLCKTASPSCPSGTTCQGLPGFTDVGVCAK